MYLRGVKLASLLCAVVLLFPASVSAAVNDGSSFILGAWQTESDLGSGVTLQQYEQSLDIKFTHHKWYLNWDQPFHLPAAQLFHSQGRTMEVTWQPWINGKGIAFGQIASGEYDAYIRTFARDVRSWGHPVLIAIAPEMDGWWSPWAINGEPGRTNLDFIAGHRRIIDLFREEGVSNVSWVWSPNVQQPNSPNRYRHAELYPGDDYVTYMGLDGYNWGTSQGGSWETFQQVFQYSYDGLLEISNKPILLMEVASAEEGGSKADWIRNMFYQLPNFPRIVGFTWFNRNRERDWRIHSSDNTKLAFKEAAAAYFRPQGSSPTPKASATPLPTVLPTLQATERPAGVPGSVTPAPIQNLASGESVLGPVVQFQEQPWRVPFASVDLPLQRYVRTILDPRVLSILFGVTGLVATYFLQNWLRKRRNPYAVIRSAEPN